jgi:beta-galactosidase
MRKPLWTTLVRLALGFLAATTLARGEERISLAGKWAFALDRADTGVAQAWFSRPLGSSIELPGILQGQGYGDEIRTDTPWVLTLGDAWWKRQPAALRDHFSAPGNVRVPFLAQPPRHYLGAAWYQRDLDIPPGWASRPVTLFLERAHWETTVWLDGRAFSPERSLSAPHVTEFGPVAPGRHRLSIRVDNRQIIRELTGDGHGADSHSISDSLGAAWNGIVGRIELRATNGVWIEDAQVFPDGATGTVRVKVRLGNATHRAGNGTLRVGTASAPVQWTAERGYGEVTAALPPNAPIWDEFHPNLQALTVELLGGADGAAGAPAGRASSAEKYTVQFGVRSISHRGRELLINGRPLNLRMTHSGGDFPLTGYPATDVPEWKRIFRLCQSYGLNGMRFHSWCPPDAAFTAADELGFYLQPECGLWSPFRLGGVYTAYLDAESAAIVQAFGNHPSFILLSPSNEPAGNYGKITPAWAAAWYAKDSRRLYSAGTGWSLPEQVTGGAQFASLVAYNGVQLRNTHGWFGGDYRGALADVNIPVIAHEVGQWCAYPDFGVMQSFTGYLRPGNYAIFRYIAEQTGVLPFDREFAWASGRFQVECYKEEIEANLRTPGLAGFQLLDLHDYLGQGTALIGVVDAFWKPKSYVTAAEFRHFNGPTIPLARLTRRTFTTAETLATNVEIAHFGASRLREAKPYWTVSTADGHVAAQGQWPDRDIALGKNQPLGSIALPLSQLSAPRQYTLSVGLKGSDVLNQWDFWLFPEHVDPSTPADVLVTSDWSATASRLAAGGKALYCPGPDALDRTRCPPMRAVPIFWNIQMTVRPPRNPTPRFDAMLGLLCAPTHPALAKFPTAANCDWQWTPLIDGVRSINLMGAPAGLKPIVAAIDDWNRNWRLGVIFEARVGPGRLMVSALDLTSAEGPPARQQLRRSLLDYMRGDQFYPVTALTPSQARSLWLGTDERRAGEPGGRAFDPDLDDGRVRANR